MTQKAHFIANHPVLASDYLNVHARHHNTVPLLINTNAVQASLHKYFQRRSSAAAVAGLSCKQGTAALNLT